MEKKAKKNKMGREEKSIEDIMHTLTSG